MNKDFESSFEKVAFPGLGMAKGVAKGIWGLGKKLVTNVNPKGIRSFAPGKALMTGFGAMEVSSVIGKTNKSRNIIKGVGTSGLKTNSFYNPMR